MISYLIEPLVDFIQFHWVPCREPPFPIVGFLTSKKTESVARSEWNIGKKCKKKLTALMSRNYQNPPFTVLNTLDPYGPYYILIYQIVCQVHPPNSPGD